MQELAQRKSPAQSHMPGDEPSSSAESSETLQTGPLTARRRFRARKPSSFAAQVASALQEHTQITTSTITASSSSSLDEAKGNADPAHASEQMPDLSSDDGELLSVPGMLDPLADAHDSDMGMDEAVARAKPIFVVSDCTGASPDVAGSVPVARIVEAPIPCFVFMSSAWLSDALPLTLQMLRVVLRQIAMSHITLQVRVQHTHVVQLWTSLRLPAASQRQPTLSSSASLKPRASYGTFCIEQETKMR